MNHNVSIQNLHKSFGQGSDIVHVLKGLSLDIAENELIMIMGPSGCGKTTLLSIIAGTLLIDQGSVTVVGNALEGMSEEQITLLRSVTVGFIFQKFSLIPTLSCAENVAVPLLLTGSSHVQAIQRAEEALEEVGQADKAHRFPETLSSGQQQLVSIARAIVHKPKIVLCDEPTSSLDIDNGLRIMNIMKGVVAKPGRSVVVVTHDARIMSFAHRVVKLENGVITV